MVDLSIAFSEATHRRLADLALPFALTIFDVEENHYLIQFS